MALHVTVIREPALPSRLGFAALVLLGGLLPAAVLGAGKPVPLKDYVKAAEFILVGSVVAVEETGDRLKIKRGTFHADYPFLKATIRVEQVIKGPQDLADVVIHATESAGNPNLVVNESSLFFIYREHQLGPWKGKRTAGQVGIHEGVIEPVNMKIGGEPARQTMEQFLGKIEKILKGR